MRGKSWSPIRTISSVTGERRTRQGDSSAVNVCSSMCSWELCPNHALSCSSKAVSHIEMRLKSHPCVVMTKMRCIGKNALQKNLSAAHPGKFRIPSGLFCMCEWGVKCNLKKTCFVRQVWTSKKGNNLKYTGNHEIQDIFSYNFRAAFFFVQMINYELWLGILKGYTFLLEWKSSFKQSHVLATALSKCERVNLSSKKQ